MNNQEAQNSIDICIEELERIYHLIQGHGHMSPIVPFLTKYSIVRACGTIEFCFKTIISDSHSGHSTQITNFIDNTIRNSSMNPNRQNIATTLNKFDTNWKISFSQKLNDHDNNVRLKSSIDSLNSARNSFAHGDTPSASFENIKNYFDDSIEIMRILDEVVTE